MVVVSSRTDLHDDIVDVVVIGTTVDVVETKKVVVVAVVGARRG